jgi:hypothetical protein
VFDIDELHLQLAILDQFAAPVELDSFASPDIVEVSEVVVGRLSQDPASRFVVSHALASPVRRLAQHLAPFHPPVTLDDDLGRPLMVSTVVHGELGDIPIRAESDDVAVTHDWRSIGVSVA